ncbi:type II toxin-antitoxin system HicB family antitoxin, partial [Methanofollis sp. UBA420]|uniref:type II toxin-antitoxin system HicB family antitoxin n=1 Tax=Methanofollis sp. UBA420 TaxID=1915514 RepID=UPI00316AD3C4
KGGVGGRRRPARGEVTSMRKYTLTAALWEEEKIYVSKCPEIGVASCGDTPDEALAHLKEAVELYLENAMALGMMEDIAPALRSPRKFAATFEVIE